MRFDTEEVNDILIVTPPAMDLDASKAEEFKRDIALVVEGHSKVAMNLERIAFMDSAGLGAMLSTFKAVRASGGLFAIYGLSDEVKALFELVRMQRLFKIGNTRESAIEFLNQ